MGTNVNSFLKLIEAAVFALNRGTKRAFSRVDCYGFTYFANKVLQNLLDVDLICAKVVLADIDLVSHGMI